MDDQTLHHFMEDLSPIVIGVALIIATAWVINTIVIAYKEKANLRTRAELYNRLLDKFGSGNEFADYLQSDTGRKFFEDMTVENVSPGAKILGSIQKGFILALVGFGLLVLGNVFDNTLPSGVYTAIIFSGSIVLMFGLGFLISTGISYRLSKSWGLIKVEEKAKAEEKTNIG